MENQKITITKDELTEIICGLYDGAKQQEQNNRPNTAKATLALIDKLWEKKENQNND